MFQGFNNVRAGSSMAHEDTYGQIRQAIIDGELHPNEHLVEKDLAARFGGSRDAIRRALARLSQEGLVLQERNRGAKVRYVTMEEIAEIMEMRAVLEGLAAREAAKRINEQRQLVLAEIITRLTQSYNANDLQLYSETNAVLHSTICKFAERPQLTRLLSTLNAQYVRIHFRTAMIPGRVQYSMKEHRDLAEAICTGNDSAAEALARNHVTAVLEALQKAR